MGSVDPVNTAEPFSADCLGSYAGVVDGKCLFIGGEKKNGELSRDLFILEKTEGNRLEGHRVENFLPEGVAFGGSVSNGRKLLLAGGYAGADRQPSGKCYLVSRNRETKEFEITETPELPVSAIGAAAGALNDDFYLAGADEKGNPFFLKWNSAGKEGWESLEPYPCRPGRRFAAAAVQNISTGKAFFMFGGVSVGGDEKTSFRDAWLYDLQTSEWRPVQPADDDVIDVTGSRALPSGTIHLIFPGKGGNVPKEELDEVSSEAKAYNTITGKFFSLGEFPNGEVPAGCALFWNGQIVMPLAAAGGAPVLKMFSPEEKKNRLSRLNQVIIAAYFLFLIAASLYFLRRMKGTDDFFRGGCRIPWWALGISIYGTITSAITYITVPAKSFMTDWCYLLLAVGPFLAVPLLIWFYIPKISKFNFTSAYEYLEYRFHFCVRLLGSVIFIIFQVMRIAILLFLPSIALNAITGIDIKTCILGVGIAGIFCTLLGGLEIVVWIEVIQIITLLIGFVLTLIVIVWRFDGSLFDMLRIAYADGKLHLYDPAPDFHLPTLWVVLIASFFLYIIPYASDQTILQRYFAGKDNNARSRGVWISLGLMVPNLLLLFLAGTLFYVFYKENPRELLVTMNNNDSLMPWFFVSQLPNGLSGCLLLALFTSAMSSVSSGINAISATYTIDFHERIFHFSREHALGTARIVTLVSGACGVLFALAMATWDIASLWDQYNLFIGLVSSSLAGIFFLGVFCKRANTPGVLIGLAVSCYVQYYIADHKMIHLLLYSGTGLMTTWIVGWLASYLFPAKELKLCAVSESDGDKTVE